jgi:hypothetical protein
MSQAGPHAELPRLVFTTPRTLPDARTLEGRVVVLDIAFAADGLGVPFEDMTGRFLADLGDRLAAWIDHHDHDYHPRYAGDPRFVLATKAQHGACPEMVTEEIVARTGPIDTILTHVDLDGLYAAAKWILGGREPYPGADEDARKVDTRIGQPGANARLIDHALRARFRDEALKHRVVRWLVGGLKDKEHRAIIAEAAGTFELTIAETDRLAARYKIRGRVAYVDAREAKGPYDKTELLLAGQTKAPVAIVHDSGMVAIAAGFDSGWDFVALLGAGWWHAYTREHPRGAHAGGDRRHQQGAGPHAPQVGTEVARPSFVSVWLRTIDRSTATFALIVIALNLIDGFATLHHVAHGAHELNPLMDALLQQGDQQFLVGKHLLACAGVVGLAAHWRHRGARRLLRLVLFPVYLGIATYQLALFAFV